MKQIIIFFLLMVSIGFAQQRPPDEFVSSYNSGSIVNAALIRAQAAVTGSGTVNQIAYWTGTTAIGSLSTATYPSLSELAYVKGVTSKIQTQINAKQGTLVAGQTIKNINGQSLLGSGNIIVGSDTTGFWLKTYNIVKSLMTGTMIIGTASTLDSMIIDFRKNNFLRLNK